VLIKLIRGQLLKKGQREVEEHLFKIKRHLVRVNLYSLMGVIKEISNMTTLLMLPENQTITSMKKVRTVKVWLNLVIMEVLPLQESRKGNQQLKVPIRS